MRKAYAVLLTVLLLGAQANAVQGRDKPGKHQPPGVRVSDAETVFRPGGADSLAEVDAETRKILDKINSAGPYEVPALPLKLDPRYAHTLPDMEPFRHVKPFKQHFLAQMEYTGPGRAIPEPADIKSVKIGFIGPIEPTVSIAIGGRSHEEALGTKMLQGAQLAVEEANARGGYLARRIPFELVISNDNGLWGSSGNEIIKLAYKDKVWAILGTIDGANTHIAIRVALKAEIVVMNTGDSDPTLMETNIPWVMRCMGDDRQQAYLLVDYLYRKAGFKRVGILRSNNRYGRFGVREIRDGSRRLGRPVPLEMSYRLDSENLSLELERLQGANVEAIVHWGDAADGARALNQMRARGMSQPFFACDRCLCEEFVKLAGANAEGVVCAYPWDPTRKDPALDAFRAAFRKRFNGEAETFAAHAYDGMNMLLWAIGAAGLNRAKVRDLLAHRTAPFKGVTGDILLSACLDDVGEAYLARREKGAWRYLSREDLGLNRSSSSSSSDAQTPESAPPGRKTTPASETRTPERANPREVLIGYFGPTAPSDHDDVDLWHAAQLAVEEANRSGGCHGAPFRLIPCWSEGPWGSGVAALARMAYEKQLCAVIGGVDGPTAHLAEQVVAKARLPLVSPASTDRSVNLANVPWAFSLAPGDHLAAPPLAAEIARRVGRGPFVILSCDDHDSRFFTAELRKALRAHQLAPRYQFEVRRGERETGPVAAEVAALMPAAAVVVGGASDSARLVSAIRAGGFTGPVFGGPAMGRRRFARDAGAAASGVVFPLLWEPDAETQGFAKAFQDRCGQPPDYAAAHAYDATRLLLDAVRKAGLDRDRIAQAIRQAAPWAGVTGTNRWDPRGGNTRALRLGTLRDGLPVPLDAPAAANTPTLDRTFIMDSPPTSSRASLASRAAETTPGVVFAVTGPGSSRRTQPVS